MPDDRDQDEARGGSREGPPFVLRGLCMPWRPRIPTAPRGALTRTRITRPPSSNFGRGYGFRAGAGSSREDASSRIVGHTPSRRARAGGGPQSAKADFVPLEPRFQPPGAISPARMEACPSMVSSDINRPIESSTCVDRSHPVDAVAVPRAPRLQGAAGGIHWAGLRKTPEREGTDALRTFHRRRRTRLIRECD